jgi:hypothetical protein
MTYLPYMLLISGLITQWFHKKLSCVLFGLGTGAAFYCGRLMFGAPLLLALALLFGSLYLSQRNRNRWAQIAAHVTFSMTALALFFHTVPGFANLKAIDAVQLAPHCKPFTMYMNLEGIIISFALLMLLVPVAKTWPELKGILKAAAFYGTLCVTSLMFIAMAVGYVKFNFKFPPQTFLFLVKNLFITCMAEEMFFRGYLQKSFMDLCRKKGWSLMLALGAASILFGLWHYQMGLPMIGLSTVAGLFYGAAFLKTERVESAILVHFALNAIHFLCFSYPAFAK